MIDISLFSNHSPSEWFSEYKKAAALGRAAAIFIKFVPKAHHILTLHSNLWLSLSS